MEVQTQELEVVFEYYPETGYYVIVLSNYGSIAGSAVADHIKDLMAPNN